MGICNDVEGILSAINVIITVNDNNNVRENVSFSPESVGTAKTTIPSNCMKNTGSTMFTK
jgi:hypothetical protein